MLNPALDSIEVKSVSSTTSSKYGMESKMFENNLMFGIMRRGGNKYPPVYTVNNFNFLIDRVKNLINVFLGKMFHFISTLKNKFRPSWGYDRTPRAKKYPRGHQRPLKSLLVFKSVMSRPKVIFKGTL